MSEYKNILLATDFSEPSKLAAARAKALADCCNAKLTVLHIVNYIPPAYVGVELPAKYASKEFLTERAHKYMTEWAESVGLADCPLIVETGSAKKRIVKQAKKLGADLVVVGAHGETGLTKIFGSVANAVAQNLKCDVLVVRP